MVAAARAELWKRPGLVAFLLSYGRVAPAHRTPELGSLSSHARRAQPETMTRAETVSMRSGSSWTGMGRSYSAAVLGQSLGWRTPPEGSTSRPPASALGDPKRF